MHVKLSDDQGRTRQETETLPISDIERWWVSRIDEHSLENGGERMGRVTSSMKVSEMDGTPWCWGPGSNFEVGEGEGEAAELRFAK